MFLFTDDSVRILIGWSHTVSGTERNKFYLFFREVMEEFRLFGGWVQIVKARGGYAWYLLVYVTSCFWLVIVPHVIESKIEFMHITYIF